MTRSKALLGLALAALVACGDVRADETGSRGSAKTFSGRSGATATKLVVVCGVPLRPASETRREEPIPARANVVEHFLRSLPEKYRPMVGAYFERLLQIEGEKK